MTTPPAQLRPAVAWSLAVGATLTMAVSYFDRQALAALSPTLIPALGMTTEQYGLLGSAFAFAYLVGSPLSGWIIDRTGSRRGLLGAVVAWSIVAALHSLVPGYGVLFALRIALGLTESPSFPGAAKTIERALPAADRARGFGLLFTGSSFGALLAPFAASALTERYGWRVAFLGTAVVGLAWIPLWLLLTRSAAARAALDPSPEDEHPKQARRGIAPILETVRHPAVQRACVVVLATAPLVGFSLQMSPKLLADVEHIAQADMGKYLWIPPLLFDIGSLLFGHLASVHARAHRGEPSKALFVFCGLLGSGLWLMLLVPGPHAKMVITGLAMAGVGGLFATFTADMLGRVPTSLVSTAGGITAAAQSLAHIVALPLAGRAIDKTGGYAVPIIALSAAVFPGVLVWLLWKPPPLREVTTDPA
jgi:ACS family hexuronate transporter-like MFS transporter